MSDTQDLHAIRRVPGKPTEMLHGLIKVLDGSRGLDAAVRMRRVGAALRANWGLSEEHVLSGLLLLVEKAGELSRDELARLDQHYGRPAHAGVAYGLAMLEAAAGELHYGVARERWLARRGDLGPALAYASQQGASLGRATARTPLRVPERLLAALGPSGAWLMSARLRQVATEMTPLFREQPSSGDAELFRAKLRSVYSSLGVPPPAPAPGEVDGVAALVALSMALLMAGASCCGRGTLLPSDPTFAARALLLSHRDTPDAAECRRALHRLMVELGWSLLFAPEWKVGAPASFAAPPGPDVADPAGRRMIAMALVADPAPALAPALEAAPAPGAVPEAAPAPASRSPTLELAASAHEAAPAPEAGPAARSPSVEFVEPGRVEAGSVFAPTAARGLLVSSRLEVGGAAGLGPGAPGRKRSASPAARDAARAVRRRGIGGAAVGFPEFDAALERLRATGDAAPDPAAVARARRVASWFGLLYCPGERAGLLRLALGELCAVLGRRPPPDQPRPPTWKGGAKEPVRLLGAALTAALDGAPPGVIWWARLWTSRRGLPKSWHGSWSERTVLAMVGACDELGWPAPAGDLPEDMPEPVDLVAAPTIERVIAAALAGE